jgi:hypothetical protein
VRTRATDLVPYKPSSDSPIRAALCIMDHIGHLGPVHRFNLRTGT